MLHNSFTNLLGSHYISPRGRTIGRISKYFWINLTWPKPTLTDMKIHEYRTGAEKKCSGYLEHLIAVLFSSPFSNVHECSSTFEVTDGISRENPLLFILKNFFCIGIVIKKGRESIPELYCKISRINRIDRARYVNYWMIKIPTSSVLFKVGIPI